jgi:hypothetical protein
VFFGRTPEPPKLSKDIACPRCGATLALKRI